MPAPHNSSFFKGRMPFLLPNQQRQSTEGKVLQYLTLLVNFCYATDTISLVQ